MDYENIQQNMNTRVVFKEPRGMVRWLQLFFGILAFSTVVDFHTTIGIDIKCPDTPNVVAPVTSPAPAPGSASTPATVPAPASVAPPAAPVSVAPLQATGNLTHPKLDISYPFDFTNQKVTNLCPNNNYTYTHVSSLNGSPQFFVMTGVLSLMYAAGSLLVYLLFSSTYESIPVMPVGDLIVTAILCLFWFIASSSFSSGVSLLKSTVTYDALQQVICPAPFQQLPGVQCLASVADTPSWKALNVALVSGFTSFFLWGAGLWFVYKETHFHTPRDTFGR